MSERDGKPRPARPNMRPETAAEQQAREERLARQLRANLRKRKRQQRGRGTGEGPGATADRGSDADVGGRSGDQDPGSGDPEGG